MFKYCVSSSTKDKFKTHRAPLHILKNSSQSQETLHCDTIMQQTIFLKHAVCHLIVARNLFALIELKFKIHFKIFLPIYFQN